jgi:lipopolysaccharide transport system ATP-binding protein
MSSEHAIRVRSVSKVYEIYRKPSDRLKQFLWRGRRRFHDEFWAVRDVSFDVMRGATVGIIGRNGSGKSTLLQLICGTLTPTVGEVELNGRVGALLELGAGFNPEFTGRENVFLYCAVLGLTEAETRDRLEWIIDFAEIGRFVDLPVKTYSSGMYVRLAFAAAINTDPDVLVIDEALAVGDARFQQRCMTKLRQLQRSGVSVLFVSHDIEAVKRLCDHVLVVHDGAVVNRGDPLAMANWYLALMTMDFDLERLRQMEASASDYENHRVAEPPHELAASHAGGDPSEPATPQCPEFKYFRHGDGSARVLDVFLTTTKGERTECVRLGEVVSVTIDVEFRTNQFEHVVGFYIRDRLGTDIIGLNTSQEDTEVPEAHAGAVYRYRFTLPIDLKPGYYSLSPSIGYHQDVQQWMDWIENALIFRVIDPARGRTVFGVYLPRPRQVQIEEMKPRGAAADQVV